MGSREGGGECNSEGGGECNSRCSMECNSEGKGEDVDEYNGECTVKVTTNVTARDSEGTAECKVGEFEIWSGLAWDWDGFPRWWDEFGHLIKVRSVG